MPRRTERLQRKLPNYLCSFEPSWFSIVKQLFTAIFLATFPYRDADRAGRLVAAMATAQAGRRRCACRHYISVLN